MIFERENIGALGEAALLGVLDDIVPHIERMPTPLGLFFRRQLLAFAQDPILGPMVDAVRTDTLAITLVAIADRLRANGRQTQRARKGWQPRSRGARSDPLKKPSR